ncbi:MAG: helix-turn-helix transcriptional regulator [Planctomycetes bacterium]|nr:helix-turn-helix transcriptional regulator [Planctomycetota bacterium]
MRSRAPTWFPDPQSPGGDVEVHGQGIAEGMPAKFVHRPQGTDEYLFIHFHDPVEILLHGVMREHPAHTLVLWPPRTTHHFGSARRRWAHTWMLCQGASLRTCIGASGLAMQEPIAQPDAEPAMRYLRLIHHEMTRFQPPDPAILEAMLGLWLREAFRASLQRSPRAAAIPERMLAVRQFIDSDPVQELALGQLAGKAGLSVSQFSSEFRRCFGTSPIRYVLNLRLKRSLFHLSDRNLTIREVALRSGFRDQHYFARQFRSHFHRAPSDHRG